MSEPLTLICHFYNESYLLPWWIVHHRGLCDSAILIDYGSTDSSREIIQELAPAWTVVSSRNRSFVAEQVDAEVMDLESAVHGWKMALNVTEFLSGDVRAATERVPRGVSGVRVPALIMVDCEPSVAPNYDHPLVAQKPWGVDEDVWRRYGPRAAGIRGRARRRLPTVGRLASMKDIVRSYDPNRRARLLHRAETGGYSVGRHSWSLGETPTAEDLKVCWFGLSPWTDDFLDRKRQIRDRIPGSDPASGFGVHHFWKNDELALLYRYWTRRQRLLTRRGC